MSIDVDESRDDAPKGPFVDATARPLAPTEETRERWGALPGPELRKDPEFMRYLQSHRSSPSLSQAGKLGFRATAERHGYDGAWEIAARERRDHPERASKAERDVVALLARLGQEPGRDYEREYKFAPGAYADMAWPDQMKLIEVWGGVHARETLRRMSPDAAEARVLRDSEDSHEHDEHRATSPSAAVPLPYSPRHRPVAVEKGTGRTRRRAGGTASRMSGADHCKGDAGSVCGGPAQEPAHRRPIRHDDAAPDRCALYVERHPLLRPLLLRSFILRSSRGGPTNLHGWSMSKRVRGIADTTEQAPESSASSYESIALS